jgi:glycerol-3-phosphate acyltransferase PlsY
LNAWVVLAAIAVGYLLGAVSFTRILGRWFLPDDDLEGVEVKLGEGTLHFDRTGASLISLKRGPGHGCLTGVLDMAKAAVPVLVFKLAFPDHEYEYFVAAAAVIGHNYPVFVRFRGGVGMSPFLGGLAILDWPAVPVVILLGTLSGLLMRNAVVSYVSGVTWLLPWFWWRSSGWEAIAYAIAVNAAVWPTVWPVMRQIARMQKRGELDRREAMRLLTRGHPSLNRDRYLSD